MSLRLRISLSFMMFIQLIMYAVWWVPLAAYLDKIGISGSMKASILSTTSFGCFSAPFICMLCDRYFRMERVLSLLNITSGILVFIAAKIEEPTLLFFTLLFSMVLFMPTQGIMNAISMKHVPANEYPKIRIWGTIGWVCAGFFSLGAVSLFHIPAFDGTVYALYAGAACHIIGGLSALLLPPTHPKGSKIPFNYIDILGLRAFTLMKKRNVAAVVIASFLMMIPFSSYFAYASSYLNEKGFEFITATLNLGQVIEIFIMFVLSWVLIRFSKKTIMIAGLVMLTIRFIALFISVKSASSLPVVIAIMTHGGIVCFFTIVSQIFIDEESPRNMQAQAQGLISLVTFGFGTIAGNYFTSWVLSFGNTTAPNWSILWLIMTVISILTIIIFAILFKTSDDSLKTTRNTVQ